MNIYGYCRISTAKQSIDRQIRNIKAEYTHCIIKCSVGSFHYYIARCVIIIPTVIGRILK